MKWILAIVCLPLAAFCVFGFLATLEPGVQHAWAFRSVYAIGALVCLMVPTAIFVRPRVARRPDSGSGSDQ